MSTDPSFSGQSTTVADDGSEDDERIDGRRRAILSQSSPLKKELDEKTDNKLTQSEARVAFAELASAITGREVSRANRMVESAQIILDEFETLRERVDAHEEFMDSYGVDKPRDQDEAWVKIVDAARNKKNNPEHVVKGSNEVALFIENIETATGFSDRHCSDLIEQYGKEKKGTRWIAHERATAANNHSATKKQLVIDLDVWGDAE